MSSLKMFVAALTFWSFFHFGVNFVLRRQDNLYHAAAGPVATQDQVDLVDSAIQPLVRAKRSSNDNDSGNSMTVIIVLAIIVGVPCFLCYTRQYNFLQCCIEDESEKRKRKRSKRSKKGHRRGKKKHKSRRRKRSSSEDDSSEKSSDDDSEDSLSESSSLGGDKHRRDKQSKRKKKDKDKERKRKRKRLKMDSSTTPLDSLKTGENDLNVISLPTSTASPNTATSSTTFLPPTPTPTTETPQPPARAPPATQQPAAPLPPEQHSADSEYAYIVYRPDTNYVAVSRTLKNLVPPNTTVVYKVDETSNLSEADSVMKSIGGAHRREPFSLPTTESLRRPGSPTSGKTHRSIRSNYFVVNSDLLLKTSQAEDQRRVSQMHRTKPPPPSQLTASSKPNDTLFVYSTKTQFGKLPGYVPAQAPQAQATQNDRQLLQTNQRAEMMGNKPTESLPGCGGGVEIPRESGLHGQPAREAARVRFSAVHDQQAEEPSELSDDSDPDENDDVHRQKKQKHRAERELRRQERKRRASGARRKSSRVHQIARRKSSNVLFDEADSEEDSDDSGDQREHKKRATERKDKKRRRSAGGRRRGTEKHRRHSSMKLAGSAKRRLKRRHTVR